MAETKNAIPKELAERALHLMEKSRKSGKVKIGTNECTKHIERGTAKLVLIAEDVNPKEVVMHLPLLCKEKKISYAFIPSKKELGERVGIGVGASAVVLLDEGDQKKELEEIVKRLREFQ